MLRELRRLLLDLLALLAEGARHALQHVAPAGHPGAALRREVGAAEERSTVGRAEDVERPSAVAVQHLLRVHVDLVDVGPLFAVDLDADHEFVLHRGDLIVLERFALHYVAPVTGGVADADQDRLVLGSRAGPGCFAPRVPVDGLPACCRVGEVSWASRFGMPHLNSAYVYTSSASLTGSRRRRPGVNENGWLRGRRRRAGARGARLLRDSSDACLVVGGSHRCGELGNDSGLCARSNGSYIYHALLCAARQMDRAPGGYPSGNRCCFRICHVSERLSSLS